MLQEIEVTGIEKGKIVTRKGIGSSMLEEGNWIDVRRDTVRNLGSAGKRRGIGIIIN